MDRRPDDKRVNDNDAKDDISTAVALRVKNSHITQFLTVCMNFVEEMTITKRRQPKEKNTL